MKKTVWMVKFKGVNERVVKANDWQELVSEIERLAAEFRVTKDDIVSINYLAY